MQDPPTAPELLDSLAEYLFGELRPTVPAEQRFKVLVAANSLRGHRTRASSWRGAEQ